MQNRLKLLHCVFLSILLLLINAGSAADERTDLTLAYLKTGLNDLNNNEKQVALQLLSDELVKNSDLQMTVKSVNTFPEIQHLIIVGEIDYVILNSYHYLTNADFIDQYMSDAIWTIQRGPLDMENYILVTHKKYKNLTLSEFRNKNISFHQQYLLMKFYLTYLVEQTSGLGVDHFFKKIKHTKTASQALLDVYFGGSDLCIVPKHIFDLTIELNPALKQNLAIFHQSGNQFIPVLIIDFNHSSLNNQQIVHKNISTINKSARGRQILEMFNIQSINRTELKRLQSMKQIFQSHKI